MSKKAETACFTGHRKMSIPTNEIRRRLSELLSRLISRGVVYYGCGGAVISHIPLILSHILP